MAWSNERENKVFGGMYSLNVRVRTTNKTLGTVPGDKELLDQYIASKAPDAVSKAEELANSYLPGDIPEEERDKMITLFPVGKFARDKADPDIIYDPLYDVIPTGAETEEVYLPFIWNYQLRGSFKESIAFIQRASKNKAKAEEKSTDAAEKPKRGRKKKSETTDAVKSEEEMTAVVEALDKSKKSAFACSKITAYKKVVDGGWFIKQRRIPMRVPETWMDELGNEHATYVNGRLPIWTRPLRADTAQGPRVCLASSEFVPVGTEYWFTVQLLNSSDKAAMLETLDFKEKVGMLQWRGGGNGTFIWTPCDDRGKPIDIEV